MITVISFVVHRIKLFINLITVPDTKYLINNTVNVSASLIAQLVKNLPTMQETPVQFLGWKICWRRGRLPTPVFLGFPCGSAGKESVCNAGDLGSIPGLGRSPGERKGYPLQYSGLENSIDCIVHEVAKSRTLLSDFHFHSVETTYDRITINIEKVINKYSTQTNKMR